MSESTTPRPIEELSFEEALEELEALTNQMARGDVTLKQSVENYTRGTALLNRCREKIDEVRKNEGYAS